MIELLYLVLILYALGGAVVVTILIYEAMRWLWRAKQPIGSALTKEKQP